METRGVAVLIDAGANMTVPRITRFLTHSAYMLSLCVRCVWRVKDRDKTLCLRRRTARLFILRRLHGAFWQGSYISDKLWSQSWAERFVTLGSVAWNS
jgi:hypothetical protein